MMRVYRVQDRDGRGPWRPGFSHVWADAILGEGVEEMPSWIEEFGPDLIAKRGLPGDHYGCAVRKSSEIARWLSASERERLRDLGFSLVSIKADRILAESRNQVVFATKLPFARIATVVPWSAVGG